MYKTVYDDGAQAYLVEGATFAGKEEIPVMMDLRNTQIPRGLISFDKAITTKDPADYRNYVHFYIHDKKFSTVLSSTRKYLPLLQKFDGVISPDVSLITSHSRSVQQMGTYFNRAIGFYLQKHGIPVIPNIRWSDERSYEFCFLGVSKHSTVAISTHGCMKRKGCKDFFRAGLHKMINALEPNDVIVHGYMPNEVFAEFANHTTFHRYPSQFELTHERTGD